MRAHPSFRPLRRALVALAVIVPVTALTGVGGPAGAIEVEPETYHAQEGERLELVYDHGMYTTDGGEFYYPDDCGLVPSCTRVPVEIVRGPGADEDYLVTITLEWDNRKLAEVPDVGTVEGNDLDLYVFHLEPVLDEDGHPTYDDDGEPVMEHVETVRSASSGMPERVQILSPAGPYDISIVNFLGVNLEFTLTFEYTSAGFTTPFEDLGERVGPPVAPPAAPTSAPERPVARPLPATPVAGPVDEPPLIEPLPEGEDEFDFAFGSRDFEDDLAAPAGARRSLFEEAAVIGPGDPPGGLTLLLWLGLVPLLVLGGTGAFLFVRRPAALSVAVGQARLDERG